MQYTSEVQGPVNCHYRRYAWVIYNTTSESTHLACYLYNVRLGNSVYETPED